MHPDFFRSGAYVVPPESLACTMRGFTLPELMVVLAIAAIVAMFAVPNFQATLDRQRISTVTADLHASVVLARTEAIRRNVRIDLVPMDGINWTTGWRVVVPPNPTGPLEVVYSRVPVTGGVTVTRGPAAVEPSLSYDGTGKSRLSTDATVPVSGEWVIAVPSRPAAPSRKLKINMLGRPSVCDPAQPAQPGSC